MTQCKRIIDYINEHGSISNSEAMMNLGVGRLASRIHDLTEEGYEFVRETVKVKNRYGESTHYTRYSLYERGKDERTKETGRASNVAQNS